MVKALRIAIYIVAGVQLFTACTAFSLNYYFEGLDDAILHGGMRAMLPAIVLIYLQKSK